MSHKPEEKFPQNMGDVLMQQSESEKIVEKIREVLKSGRSDSSMLHIIHELVFNKGRN